MVDKIKRAARSKKYYDANKEKYKAYRHKNKEKVKEYEKKYASSAKGIETTGNGHLPRKYGITTEEYNRIFAEQKGKCRICAIHQGELSRAFDVDHNHETGKVRGLLCNRCNQGIGLLNHDINILSTAIEYLGGTNA